jgi:ADP-ribose pyrophosphatase YjhB (NUDIX family)
MEDTTIWKHLAGGPRPYVTVSGMAYDSMGNFPVIYRSSKVRSAKECWSLPSGLHEIGLDIHHQFSVELAEELGLTAVPGTGEVVGVYENIARVDGYHWVILLMTVKVETLDTLVNREPDKHPMIDKVNVRLLEQDHTLGKTSWAPCLGAALEKYHRELAASIRRHL